LWSNHLMLVNRRGTDLMSEWMSFLRLIRPVLGVVRDLAVDAPHFVGLSFHSRTALIAENLFLRKRLAFYQEHQIRPRRLTNAARFSFVIWSRLFAWRSALLVVKPPTRIGWHRKAFRLFRKRKSRLKLGIRVSPRTGRAYWPTKDPGSFRHSQNWSTFVRNHARGLLACDFMVAVTANSRILYVFVVMEIGSRRILHCKVTQHPTSEWTIQQLREAIPSDHENRYLIHDRHSTFSSEMASAVGVLGLAVVKTPVRTPQAKAF
jgi:putative transposase